MNYCRSAGLGAIIVTVVLIFGCGVDSSHTYSRNYALTRTPVDPPKKRGKFDECTTGGELFRLYCSSCHNGRPLGERNFRASEAAMSHMRTQAYLTGEEYRKLMHFLRRWHNLGPPIPEVEPSPKRFFYSQPIAELKPNSEPLPAPVQEASAGATYR